jgi:hypothetical protein
MSDSGYSSAFTRPDPMDPNDRALQKTQSRAGTFPYDRDVSYGSAEVPDAGGAKRQVGYGGQLTPWFLPDDDGDIEKEAIGTPINFKQSSGGGSNGGLTIPGQSRGFAGSTKDNLETDVHWDVFGEDSFLTIRNIVDGDLRDLQTGELRDISQGGMGLVGHGLSPQANQRPADSLVDALGADEDMWPQEVRSRQLRSLDDEMSLGECFAVYNDQGDEVISLLETLDWER